MGSKKILGQKNFGSKKNLGQKKLCSKKICGWNKFLLKICGKKNSETNAGIEGLHSLKIWFFIFDGGQMCQLTSNMESQMTKWSLNS